MRASGSSMRGSAPGGARQASRLEKGRLKSPASRVRGQILLRSIVWAGSEVPRGRAYPQAGSDTAILGERNRGTPGKRRISGAGNSGDDALAPPGFHSAASATACGAENAEKKTLKASALNFWNSLGLQGRGSPVHHSVAAGQQQLSEPPGNQAVKRNAGSSRAP